MGKQRGGVRKVKRQQEYLHRKEQWLSRYGSLQALERTFGKSTNSLFGDLTPEQTRRLYHTLLPRSLLGLYEMGVFNPEELAPLAYQARMAAKDYARSRCRWDGRLLTAMFDQYRSLRDRGQFQNPRAPQPTWEAIYQKYEQQIVEEECRQALANSTADVESCDCQSTFIDQETLPMRIYLRILERSCATNQAFDKLFLKPASKCNPNGECQNLEVIADQLDRDVKQILLSPNEQEKADKREQKGIRQENKALQKEEKTLQKVLQKEEKRLEKVQEQQRKIEKKKAKGARKKSKDETPQLVQLETKLREDNEVITATSGDKLSMAPKSQEPPKRWEILRIMAGTRQKFRSNRQKRQERNKKMKQLNLYKSKRN